MRDMPSTYDKLGVRFLYPDNWILDEEDAPNGNPSVTVQSPGGAFWSLAIHSPTTDPEELAQGRSKHSKPSTRTPSPKPSENASGAR